MIRPLFLLALLLVGAPLAHGAQNRPRINGLFEQSRVIDVCEAIGRSARMRFWYNADFDRDIRIDLTAQDRDYVEVLDDIIGRMNAVLTERFRERPQLYRQDRVTYRIQGREVFMEQARIPPDEAAGD